jgi:uncharacterized phage protein (TIGR01671 family)
MREILFKAKRIDNGEWVEGLIACPHCTDTEKGVQSYYFNEVKNGHWYQRIVSADTICQYTGLTDKNGNKIWENDVLKKVDTNALGWVRERYCKVSFNKMGYWMITTEYGDGYWIGEFESEQLEVIGNIFDNPELVKE